MQIFYDFHIHSVLSPCAEMEMTPHSIVGMASVKGLQAIAITDHNGIENVEACMKVGETYSVLVVPGIEVQTIEDVHVLCLFPEIDDLRGFYRDLEMHRLLVKHQPLKFGRQVMMSEKDEELGDLDFSLYFSYAISLSQVFGLVDKHKGAFVPAHVDRKSFSIISQLGFIPLDLPVKYIEFSNQCDIEDLMIKSPMLKRYTPLIDSDAHQLEDINEPDHMIDVDALTSKAIVEKLRRG